MTDAPQGPPIPGVTPEQKRSDISDKRELHEAAKELLDNAAFKKAILELRKRWFAELLLNGGGNLKGAEIVARIQALEAIPNELTVIINDYKMAAKQSSRN